MLKWLDVNINGGNLMPANKSVILDLCGGTGSWSKPYKDAGYDVRVVTLPDMDVRLFEKPKEDIHGILAAPPCTFFCRMRMCRGKPTNEQFVEGLSVVDACMRIITICKPKFWALENPQGYLKRWLGEPRLKFDPYEYGDHWTKRTWIWGNFNRPMKWLPVKPTGRLVGGKKNDPSIAHTAEDNAKTPEGFARAFYEANK